MRRRGEYRSATSAPPRQRRTLARVGGPLLHTVGERADVIRQLDHDFAQTEADVRGAIGWGPGHPWALGEGSAESGKGNPIWNAWWHQFAGPAFAGWVAFRRENLGEDPYNTASPNDGGYAAWGERFTLRWSTIEDWRAKLVALRAAARLQGIKLTGDEPADLPRDLVDRVASLPGDVAGVVSDWWRPLVYTGAALAGVLALSSIAQIASAAKGR